MIGFLEDRDPTLRLSCRSWLSQSLQMNRILDPFLQEFYVLSNFQRTDLKVLVRGNMDAEQAINNFAQLRLIMSSQVIDYIIYKRPENQDLVSGFSKMLKSQVVLRSDQIPDVSSLFTDANQGKLVKYVEEHHTYLYFLGKITLDFIRAENEDQADDDMAS